MAEMEKLCWDHMISIFQQSVGCQYLPVAPEPSVALEIYILIVAAAGANAPCQPTVTDTVAKRTFPLCKLPPELAEMVYTWALVSGNTGVLRLSQETSQIASLFRFKAGIFRIDFQEYQDEVSAREFEISTQTANSIQNVEVQIEIVSSVTRNLGGRLPGPLTHFMDSPIQRGTCYITFKSDNPRAHHSKPVYVLGCIQRLRGFKTVIVRAIAGDDHNLTLCPAAAARPTNPALTRVRERLMREMVQYDLEEIFGCSMIQKSDEQGIYLEFHPIPH